MDEVWKEHLKNAGADIAGAVARFAGNEDLYVKFLMKFPQDTTFSGLSRAMEDGDMEEALRASHTLKGLSGNLGLTSLFNACSEFVTAVRSNEQGRCPELYREINHSYQAIMKVIKENEG